MTDKSYDSITITLPGWDDTEGAEDSIYIGSGSDTITLSGFTDSNTVIGGASVTGISVFQEKMNRRDTLSAQMVASKIMQDEGEGQGEGKGAIGKTSYRPTKESELKLLGEKDKSMGLSAAELESADTRLSKLFGSKTKEKTVKSGRNCLVEKQVCI